ncbi:CapA family protein [Candidatus Poribacteria bacterium]|nr:CapA family protein [Candidatus Poribacteria bacterium]
MKAHFLYFTLAIVIFQSGIPPIAASTTPQENESEISIIAVGDITIGSTFTPLIERSGAGVFFEGTASIIQSADIATVSLNSSISDRGEPDPIRETRFRAAPGLARALANAGFDAISLATPNIMDFGIVALEDTVTNLEWYNLKSMGAGITSEAANEPAWIKDNDKKIALFAYLRGNEFNMASLDPVASAAYSQMIQAVKNVENQADLVIVWIHWGKSDADAKTRKASIGRQRIFAKALIDQGADLVLCQQLHSLGGIEIYNEKPIVYSLADFIYDNYSLQYARTIIPRIVYNDGKLKFIELIPILADKMDKAIPQPSLLHTKEIVQKTKKLNLQGTAIDTLKDYQKRCAELNTEVIIKEERGWIETTNITDDN